MHFSRQSSRVADAAEKPFADVIECVINLELYNCHLATARTSNDILLQNCRVQYD